MTELLSMLNPTVSKMVMKSQPLFDVWQDANAQSFKDGCIERQVQNHKKSMANIANNMRTFELAEEKIQKAFSHIEELL